MGAKQSIPLPHCRSTPTTDRPSTIELDVDIVSAKISFHRKLLLVITEDGKALVVYLETGKEIPFEPELKAVVVDGDWHVDGKTLAIVSSLGALFVYRLVEHNRHFTKIGSHAIAGSPSNILVATCSFNNVGTLLTTYYSSKTAGATRSNVILQLSFDGTHLLPAPQPMPPLVPSHQVTCIMQSVQDPHLLVIGTSNGQVVLKNAKQDFQHLRMLKDRSGTEDAHDRKQRGHSARVLKDAGFSARELRDAGFEAHELLCLCQKPPMDVNTCNFSTYLNASIICENKYGTITFVHPKDPADIQVLYQDGSTHTINTHDQCMATDYLIDGSVRLLQWKHPQKRYHGALKTEDENEAAASCFDKNCFQNAVSFLAQSTDGALLLCGSTDTNAFIVVTKTRRIWHRLTGQTCALTCGAFTQKSSHFCCTASRDCTAFVYDVFDGDLKFVVHGHTYLISSVQFTPTDQFVVTSSWDNTVLVSSANDGEKMWSNKYESEVITFFFGDNAVHEALIVVTKEGELHYISASDLGHKIETRTDRVIDIKITVLLGLHRRLGKHSFLQMLAGSEVVVRIVFDFLFHESEHMQNVVSKRMLSNSTF